MLYGHYAGNNKSFPDFVQKERRMDDFMKELSVLLNRYGKDSDTNTPDYILAEYLKSCIESFERAIDLRDAWHNKDV